MKTKKYKIEKIKDTNSEKEIIEAIKELGTFTSFKLTIPKGSYLMRGRFNLDDWGLESTDGISINPETDKIPKGRCNPEKYPVFYCCSHPCSCKKHQRRTELTAISESSKLYRKETELILWEYGYISQWEVTTELNMTAFLNYDFGDKTDSKIILYREKFKQQLFANYPDAKESWKINNLISKHFAKEYEENDKHKYKITSILSKHIMDTKSDGVIFPSVMKYGSGINLVVSQKAMNKLKLVNIKKIKNTKNNYSFINKTLVKSIKFDGTKII